MRFFSFDFFSDQHIEHVLKTCVFLFGITMLVSISAGYVAWSILFLAILFDIWKSGNFPQWQKLPLFRLFLLYVSWGFLSSLMGAGLERSLHYWRSDLLCFLFWSLCWLFARFPKTRLWALRGFWIGAVFLSIMGIFQYLMVWYLPSWNVWFLQSSSVIVRKFSMLPHHAYRPHGNLHILTYAEAMAIAGLFALGQSWRRKWYGGFVVMLFFTSILVSLSRGAALSFAAGALVFFTVTTFWYRKIPWKAILPLLFIAAMIFQSPLVWARFKSALQPDRNRDRLIMWKVGMRMINDHPITGVGIGHVKTLWNQYCEQEWKKHLQQDREAWSDVHSLYFQQASERGIPGLAIILSLLVGFMVILIKRIRSIPLSMGIQHQRELVLAGFCVMLAFLIMNITESAFQDTEVVFAIYFILAITLTDAEPVPPRPD